MRLLRLITFPFSIIYDFATIFRNKLYDLNILESKEFKTPCIVVGNLSAGGTGKTPQIEYLIRLLQEKYKIAVLSRGYKRKTRGFLIANQKTTVEDIGDEPFQYFQKFSKIIVSVDSDRKRGISQLEELKNPPDVILLDDAFQHRKIKAGLAILLTSYNNLFCNDFLLPAGNLRESRKGAQRAQIIIITKCPDDLNEENKTEIIEKLKPLKHQNVFFTSIAYDNDLKGSSSENLNSFKGGEVVLVTGIANPKPMLNYLSKNEIVFHHFNFPDHYAFKNKDIDTIKKAFSEIQSNKKTVLTTEKDYVRIFEKFKNLHYLLIKTQFITDQLRFDNIIKNYVEQSSRNR